jgi:Mn-dependent DtxR family transcriptional regulator
MPREHLTLLDLSDREFLLVVMDASDGDGWADSQDIANLLDVERRNASSRLSWLVRWGVVEREHARDESGNLRYRRDGKAMHTQRWRLTAIGADLATGKLRKAQEAALAGARDAEVMMLARTLAQRQRTMPFAVGKLMTREWKWGVEHRNGDS